MMRQEDKFDEFDLKVRDLLKNAEEAVPPRVWGAISSRLDDMGPARHDATRRLVLTAVSFALAAAVAIGLLLPHNFNKNANTPSQAVPEQELLADGTPVLPVGSPVEGEDVSASAQSFAQPYVQSSAQQFLSEKPELNSGTLRDDALVVDSGHSDQPSGASPVQSGTTAHDLESAEPSAAPSAQVKDPFDADNTLVAMADWGNDEDSDWLSRKLSVGLEGVLNVNDSRLVSGMDSRAHMTYGISSHTVSSIEEESVSAYDIPLSFGLSIRYQFAPRFSVGTGITYSLIGRTFSGTYYEVEDGITTRKIQGDIRHTMHYLGVPVNFYFDFVQAKAINCYVYAGGTADFCVVNKYSIEDVIFRDPVSSPQFSVGAGLGVQFRLSKLIGLYIDPGIRYYFRCDQPKSIRTDQPFMVNFEAGLRFNL